MAETKNPSVVQSSEAGLRRAWHVLRDALRGTSRDFTEGSLFEAVLVLSVPMILEMSMESLFGIVDVYFVGRLGPEAVASVGVTEALLTLVFSVAMGLSMSTTATVARRVGEKDDEAAAVAAVQAIGLGLLIAVPVALAGILIPGRLLAWMGAPPSVINVGWGFTAWMLGGCATILELFLINAVFRGAGDASVAMRSLWVANAVNLVLDPCLIFGLGGLPRLGVMGAAVATTIGRGVGVLYQVRALVAGRARMRIAWRHVRLVKAVALRLVQLSLAGCAQFLIGTASWLLLVHILTPYGADALAGYTLAFRIIVVAILPAWGMCNAAATLVGQNLGAGKPDRAEKAVWLTGLANMAFLGTVAVAFLALGRPLLGLFTSDPGVLAVGTSALRIISYGYVFYAWGMVMVQAFNGAGDTLTPTWINVFCYWFFQVPLAWQLARPGHLGTNGVFWAITLAESAIAVVGVLCFRQGRWKTRVV